MYARPRLRPAPKSRAPTHPGTAERTPAAPAHGDGTTPAEGGTPLLRDASCAEHRPPARPDTCTRTTPGPRITRLTATTAHTGTRFAALTRAHSHRPSPDPHSSPEPRTALRPTVSSGGLAVDVGPTPRAITAGLRPHRHSMPSQSLGRRRHPAAPHPHAIPPHRPVGAAPPKPRWAPLGPFTPPAPPTGTPRPVPSRSARASSASRAGTPHVPRACDLFPPSWCARPR